MRIFHIATLADWKAAQDSGSYTTSTRGRTLEEEGFIHAAHGFQVPVVRDRFYAEVTEPLVVLEIDTDLLDVEVREEQVGDEVYPHVYGPIPASAVVAWRPARLPPIDLAARTPSPPPPPLTLVFRGVALLLTMAALTTFVCAVIAQSGTDNGTVVDGVAFLLWSLLAVLAVPIPFAWVYGEWLRRQETP